MKVGWDGEGDLLRGPLEMWWLGDARGETLFSGELFRKHWGLSSGLVWFSKPVVLLHTASVCSNGLWLANCWLSAVSILVLCS